MDRIPAHAVAVDPPAPGALVEYHGSLVELHGRYRAIGQCMDCGHREDVRYELVRIEADGRERLIEHVRRQSFTIVDSTRSA